MRASDDCSRVGGVRCSVRARRGALDHLRAVVLLTAGLIALPTWAGAQSQHLVTITIDGAPVSASVNYFDAYGGANITYEHQGQSVTVDKPFPINREAVIAWLKARCESAATRWARGTVGGIPWTSMTSAERAAVVSARLGRDFRASPAPQCQHNAAGSLSSSIEMEVWFPTGSHTSTNYPAYINYEPQTTPGEVAAQLTPGVTINTSTSTDYNKNTGAVPASIITKCYSPWQDGMNKPFSRVYFHIAASTKTCAAALDEFAASGFFMDNAKYQHELMTRIAPDLGPGDLDEIFDNVATDPSADCVSCGFTGGGGSTDPGTGGGTDPGTGGGGTDPGGGGTGTCDPAIDPNCTTDPGTGGGGGTDPGTGGGTDPPACDPLTGQICDEQGNDLGDGPPVDGLEINAAGKLSFGAGWLPRACPAPISVPVPVLGTSLDFDLSPLCEYLPIFAAILKALSVLVALRVLFGGGE